ncbi:MAG: GxxExxY protein [Gemmatimonadota bacterium]
MGLQNNDQRLEAASRALPERELTGKLIKAFFDVYNEVGYGFLESVYSAALEILLTERGHKVDREKTFDIYFHGRLIGRFRADFLVDDRVMLENKAGTGIPPGTREQLQNYLRSSRIEVGLIFHYGPEPAFKRVVFSRAPDDQI